MPKKDSINLVRDVTGDDGQWVQLLGVDPKRHFAKTYAAFGPVWPVVTKAVASVAFGAVPLMLLDGVRGRGLNIERLVPTFAALNNRLVDEFARRE
eukprot:gene48881-1830_t